jgi:hypothetical protein
VIKIHVPLAIDGTIWEVAQGQGKCAEVALEHLDKAFKLARLMVDAQPDAAFSSGEFEITLSVVALIAPSGDVPASSSGR